MFSYLVDFRRQRRHSIRRRAAWLATALCRHCLFLSQAPPYLKRFQKMERRFILALAERKIHPLRNKAFCGPSALFSSSNIFPPPSPLFIEPEPLAKRVLLRADRDITFGPLMSTFSPYSLSPFQPPRFADLRTPRAAPQWSLSSLSRLLLLPCPPESREALPGGLSLSIVSFPTPSAPPSPQRQSSVPTLFPRNAVTTPNAKTSVSTDFLVPSMTHLWDVQTYDSLS